MKIFGMGTDVVPVDRFAKLADSDEAIMNERLFTQDEANDLQRINHHRAGSKPTPQVLR